MEEHIQWWNSLEDNWKKQLINNISGLRFKFSESNIEHHLEDILKITSVSIDKSYPVQSFKPLEKLPLLESLDIDDAEDIPDELYHELAALTRLKKLDVSEFYPGDITFLKGLTDLEELTLDPGFSGDGGIEDITPLKQLTALKELTISGPEYPDDEGLNDLSPLESLTLLERLTINYAAVEDLQGLNTLSSLEYLELEGFSALRLNGIEQLGSLTELVLTNFEELEDISALGALHSLEELEISDCPEIGSLDAIKNLSSLQKISISGALPVNDLSFLSGLQHLTAVSVSYGNLSDISAIRHLEKLEFLMMGHNSKKYDGIEVLLELPNLKQVHLNKRGLKDAAEVLKTLRADRPELKLVVN